MSPQCGSGRSVLLVRNERMPGCGAKPAAVEARGAVIR